MSCAWHSAMEIILCLKSKGWVASGAGRLLLGSAQSLPELIRLFQKRQLWASVLGALENHDGQAKAIARKGSVEGFEPPDKSWLRATDGK